MKGWVLFPFFFLHRLTCNMSTESTNKDKIAFIYNAWWQVQLLLKITHTKIDKVVQVEVNSGSHWNKERTQNRKITSTLLYIQCSTRLSKSLFSPVALRWFNRSYVVFLSLFAVFETDQKSKWNETMWWRRGLAQTAGWWCLAEYSGSIGMRWRDRPL